MKNIKTFEEFVNENEEKLRSYTEIPYDEMAKLIDDTCKSTIDKSNKIFRKFLNKLKKFGYITSFKTEIKAFRTRSLLGYKIEFSYKYNYKDIIDKHGDEKLSYINNNLNRADIEISPSPAFLDGMKDHGRSYFDGILPQPTKNPNKSWPKFNVKNESDIKKVENNFIDLLEDILKEYEEILELK